MRPVKNINLFETKYNFFLGVIERGKICLIAMETARNLNKEANSNCFSFKFDKEKFLFCYLKIYFISRPYNCMNQHSGNQHSTFSH